MHTPRSRAVRHRMPWVGMVVFAAVLTGCGDAGMLDGLGERGHEYVEGSTTLVSGEIALTTEPPMEVAPIEGMRWYNEELPDETLGEPSFVIASVWARGDGITRFIQASPNEIAAVLPNIQFPSLVPPDTFSITSQLVFDIASGTLDPELSAAFGFWAVTPYAADNASAAVLRVAQDAGAGVTEGITVVPAEDGVNVRWIDGGYSYELSCRSQLTGDVCQQMATSAVALQIIAPEPAAE